MAGKMGSEGSVQIPRIVIAGTHSGCGKTMVARGIMQAFRERGLVVQPFKVGPDFIDPGYHSAICARHSRNLDPFMMGGDGVLATFFSASRGADIAVIEGVMGMFDGIDGTDFSSTAHVARILDAPVILVTDVRGMSRSVHAVIRGFAGYDPALRLSGVVFNRVGSDRHRSLIERGLETRALGFIPRDPALSVESRHLGLRMAFETEGDPGVGAVVAGACDLDAILETARSAPPLAEPVQEAEPVSTGVTIGVACDQAFCFYYQDNIERLEKAGATIVRFSPLQDELPAADGYYLGGGYPELHAADLEEAGCRRRMKDAVESGIPVFGECGGLMYLSESITVDGRTHRMAGVLPASAVMTGKIRALGYSLGHWKEGPGLGPKGRPMRGHEFHYSYLDCSPDARFAIDLSRGSGILSGRDGLYSHETVGTYTHSYFSDAFTAAFVQACQAARNDHR